MLKTSHLLDSSGKIQVGEFSYEENDGILQTAVTSHSNTLQKPYLAEGVPVEVHIHGIGSVDFSKQCDQLDLDKIQQLFHEEGTMGIPTIFLDQTKLDDFCRMMKQFSERKEVGELQNVLGIALEGPVLVAAGGTPQEGNWRPTWSEWEKIATCGEHGLQYVVISPDWDTDKFGSVVELLLSNGVRPALGHCKKNTVTDSLRGIETAVETASKLGHGPNSGAVITDHLFNDMPRTFKHAWRTVDEKRRRSRELANVHLSEWSFDRLEEQIGEVPASLMKHAREGFITLMLNFDGEHVDLEVSRRAYELVGPEGIMAMTDRTETNTLGKWNLRKADVGTLWYQDKGYVAAGSSNMDEQMKNMRSLGISEHDIWKMCSLVPYEVFQALETGTQQRSYMTYVDERNVRTPLEVRQAVSLHLENNFKQQST